MAKRVFFNEIEILTEEGDVSARNLLGIVESVVDRLESDLDKFDENFRIFIETEVTPNHPIRHNVSMRSISNNGTKGKVLKILEKSTNSHGNNISGTVRFDLQVEDV